MGKGIKRRVGKNNFLKKDNGKNIFFEVCKKKIMVRIKFLKLKYL